MDRSDNRLLGSWHGQRGFVMPAVLFAIVLMSLVAVSALVTSGDEHRSALAVRESAASFYAAESGMNKIWGTWDDSLISDLSPGDSMDLGWEEFENGDSFRGVIYRVDNGGQEMYALHVTGRSKGAIGGERVIGFVLTEGEGSSYSLGECCQAAVTVRGTSLIEDQFSGSGHDANPPGWGDACPDAQPENDRPGILAQDTSLHDQIEDSEMHGEPPLQEDSSIDDETFNQFGDATWDEIKDQADIVWNQENASPQPSKVWDDDLGQWVCDTSDPLNWGSPDPNHPCFNYFPTVLVQGDVTLEYGYGQGVVILDYDPATEKGTEFDVGDDAIFNGVILGKGCVEIEENAVVHGAIFVDGTFADTQCGSDEDFAGQNGSVVNYSQCAIDRVLAGGSLEQYSEQTGMGVRLVPNRSFVEVVR